MFLVPPALTLETGLPSEVGDELKSHLFLVHFSVLFSVKIE